MWVLEGMLAPPARHARGHLEINDPRDPIRWGTGQAAARSHPRLFGLERADHLRFAERIHHPDPVAGLQLIDPEVAQGRHP